MSKPLERTSEGVDHDVEHILGLQCSRRAARRVATSEVEAGADELNFFQKFFCFTALTMFAVRSAVGSPRMVSMPSMILLKRPNQKAESRDPSR